MLSTGYVRSYLVYSVGKGTLTDKVTLIEVSDYVHPSVTQLIWNSQISFLNTSEVASNNFLKI